MGKTSTAGQLEKAPSFVIPIEIMIDSFRMCRLVHEATIISDHMWLVKLQYDFSPSHHMCAPLLTLEGDIGTDPKEVEQNLEKHFTLAHKWGCVLLLDEADVFLAKRDVSTFRHHCPYGYVTVFLTEHRNSTLQGMASCRVSMK